MGRDWSKLRSWIIRRRLEGQSVAEICVQAQVSRKVFYYWWNRYRAEGWRGLEEKARGRSSVQTLTIQRRKESSS